MATHTGLLTVWTNVDAASEADFHEWYDREHLQERVDVPGFRNARRYRTAESPTFFAAYDTDSLAVLSSPVYQQALANQTEWSKRVFKGFRDTVRVVGEVVGAAGGGYGGWLLALRCTPLPGKAAGVRGAEVRAALSGGIAARLVQVPGIVRVAAMVGNVSALQVFGAGATDPADPTRAVLVVEGSNPAALAALAKGALADSELEKLGLSAPASRNIYTLQYAITR
jgi:hypothetical protein